MKMVRAEFKTLFFTEQAIYFWKPLPQGAVNAQSLEVCPLGQGEIGLVLGKENHGGLTSRAKLYLAQEIS